MRPIALATALLVSAVAAYYSILGLTLIFVGAFWPVVVMGASLELAKVVGTSWLYRNWSATPRTIRYYLTSAIVLLSLITSIGIFGFLSRAHSDQGLVSGEAVSKLMVYDEKIKTAKENIEADRKQLKQMDEAVDQIMARSTTEEGAAKSNAVRKAQARDRNTLAKNIEANQKLIAALNEEAAPLRAEVRKVEAEVGPIKYVANFLYGETDPRVLERAVTWMIVMIIIVFDPMALALLIAANTITPNTNKTSLPEIQIPLKRKRKSDTVEIGANSIMRME